MVELFGGKKATHCTASSRKTWISITASSFKKNVRPFQHPLRVPFLRTEGRIEVKHPDDSGQFLFFKVGPETSAHRHVASGGVLSLPV